MSLQDFLADPILFISTWLQNLLAGWKIPSGLATVIVFLVGILALVIFAMVFDIFLVWVERKVVARFQDRLGPNRIGPFGLVHPLADIIKLVIKEDITPDGADKVVYNIAPVLAAVSVILLWAVLPLSSKIFGVDLNVAVLYLVAAGALGSLAIIMAGWSSNNKYALLGAYRMVANMVSYEIPMVVTLLIPTILADTMSLNGITRSQETIWYVFLSPLGMIIFLISSIAELGRSPFDLNEAESEIVAGFHIEYSGMKFGWFYASELLHAFTFGGFVGILFFGGWQVPFLMADGFHIGGYAAALPGIAVILLQALAFMVKAMIGYWVIMWVKYSMPRIRIDQMLAFNWKFLTPLSLVLLSVTAILTKLLSGFPAWVFGAGMFLSNVLIGWVTIEILRFYARRQRRLEEQLAQPAPAAAHH
jgi:NADH-quinone oxidoreductase subunit H